MRHKTEAMRSRHNAQAAVLSRRGCKSKPDGGHVRGCKLLGEAILVPAHERVAAAEFVEQPRGFEHDVWSNELFHAVEYARVRAEVPGPAKVVVWLIETCDAAAERRAHLVDFGAKLAHLVPRENRDRIEEAEFLVIN